MSWLIFFQENFSVTTLDTCKKKTSHLDSGPLRFIWESVRLGGGSDLSWLQAYSNDQGLNEAQGGGNGHFFNDFFLSYDTKKYVVAYRIY